LVSNIWSDITAPNRYLTGSTLSGGGALATENYLSSALNSSINSATSSIITEVLQNRTLINNLNDISASEVWAYAGRDLDNPTTLIASTSEAIWSRATSSLTNLGSIGKLFVDNLDAKVSSRGTSMLTAADVWDAANRTLTDYSTTSIALGVWANAARTLTNYGNDITAADVWSVLTSTLSNVGSIGKQLSVNIDTKSSNIMGAVLDNKDLINNLSLISANDVWSYAGRSLDNTGTLAASTSEAVWNAAIASFTNSGTIGKLFVDNLDAKISTRATSSISAAEVWAVADRTLTDYSTSTITQAIWANANRTLTSYGNDITAADVWSVLSSSLTVANSIGKQLAGNIDAKSSDIFNEVLANGVLLNNLNDISAADVWSYVGRDLDNPAIVVASTSAAVWNTAIASFTNSGTIGKLFVDNLDAKISSRSTSSLTAADIWSAANRTLTDYSTSSIAQAIWANANRTLTSYGNDITAADVWNVVTSTLTNVGTIGKQLSENIDVKSSNIMAAVVDTQTLINNLNDISASDIWLYAGRSLDNTGTIVASTSEAVWNAAVSSLTNSGTIGKLFVDNLDAKISSIGTSSLTAADVWNAANRTLTDYSTSTISQAVWNNAARTLTNYGNNITAADVWNVLSSSLSVENSIGKQLAGNLDAKSSDILSEVLANGVLLNNLNDISASEIWSYAGRSLDNTGTIVASTSEAVWNAAVSSLINSGTIGKLFVDNLDVKISSRATSSITAADVWSAANRTLTDYSTSSITQAIWASANRTLTSYGNDITAADVWNVLTSTLVDVGTIGRQVTNNLDTAISTRASLTTQQAGWTVSMSNVDSIAAGKTYRAKVYVLNSDHTATDSNSVPAITIYDADRNIVVSGVAMNKLSNGVYEYTYSVADSAAAGLWETSVATEVTAGKTVQTNDFWVVEASPAQVIINSITDSEIPSISANVTITNEGLTGYEYHYEWCVVASASNACGGGDDLYYGSAAKYINPGDDFNTDLTATLSASGNYFFKLVVYFGTDHSGASRSFTATGVIVTPPAGGGGGGGGGGALPPAVTTTVPVSETRTCNGADFNHDKKVNSIDFSILLAFWKTTPPFRNPCVDINDDKNVNSVDFSILMYEWGSKK
jgi:nitric oxide synthase oxygenase domain/subunit